MELVNYLFKKIFFEELTDVEISKEVESLLEKQGFGQRFVLAYNKLPLFFRNNIFQIQERVLKNNGSLEIITKEPSKINNYPIQFKGNVGIYQNRENLKREFAVFYNHYLVTHYDKKKNTFFVWSSSDVAKNYLKLFDVMKEHLSLDIIKKEKLIPTTFQQF